MTMNWAIYQSFARIPLGIAVTIEFLGPLTVAVIGSRRFTDLIWVVLAGAGVALLGVSRASLTAAGSWVRSSCGIRLGVIHPAERTDRTASIGATGTSTTLDLPAPDGASNAGVVVKR
jgi:threonine/homoserine efflux transporter RhtA